MLDLEVVEGGLDLLINVSIFLWFHAYLKKIKLYFMEGGYIYMIVLIWGLKIVFFRAMCVGKRGVDYMRKWDKLLVFITALFKAIIEEILVVVFMWEIFKKLGVLVVNLYKIWLKNLVGVVILRILDKLRLIWVYFKEIQLIIKICCLREEECI